MDTVVDDDRHGCGNAHQELLAGPMRVLCADVLGRDAEDREEALWHKGELLSR